MEFFLHNDTKLFLLKNVFEFNTTKQWMLWLILDLVWRTSHSKTSLRAMLGMTRDWIDHWLLTTNSKIWISEVCDYQVWWQCGVAWSVGSPDPGPEIDKHDKLQYPELWMMKMTKCVGWCRGSHAEIHTFLQTIKIGVEQWWPWGRPVSIRTMSTLTLVTPTWDNMRLE